MLKGHFMDISWDAVHFKVVFKISKAVNPAQNGNAIFALLSDLAYILSRGLFSNLRRRREG